RAGKSLKSYDQARLRMSHSVAGPLQSCNRPKGQVAMRRRSAILGRYRRQIVDAITWSGTVTQRCNWATSEALAHYHDTEWGVPSRDDQHLFEMLVLEGAQAGWSWAAILNKRAGYRRAFADFDIDEVARFTPKHVDKLVTDES